MAPLGQYPSGRPIARNRPKSNINPALAAGINAVFVPHDNAWILEHETVNPAPEVLLEVKVADLQSYFWATIYSVS